MKKPLIFKFTVLICCLCLVFTLKFLGYTFTFLNSEDVQVSTLDQNIYGTIDFVSNRVSIITGANNTVVRKFIKPILLTGADSSDLYDYINAHGDPSIVQDSTLIDIDSYLSFGYLEVQKNIAIINDRCSIFGLEDPVCTKYSDFVLGLD